MKNKKCKCGGKFEELSIYDDWDHKVTCNKCGIRVDSDPERNVKPSTPKMIHQYSPEEKLKLLDQICGAIYIARNISMDQKIILDNLAKIDTLYRTPTEYEE